MTRRLLQAIAGAERGGAEIFFVRLAAALQRAGERQRVLIRKNSARAQSLRAAGVAVSELPFGGVFDLATRRGLRREIATWSPHIVMTWMSRATRHCPPGNFVHVARLGGYYDLKYYRRCDYLVCNTHAILEYAVAENWPSDRVAYLPNFVPDASASRELPDRCGCTQCGAPACCRARPTSSEQGLRSVARGARPDTGSGFVDRRGGTPAAAARRFGGSSRDHRPSTAFWDGAKMRRHCWRAPISLSVRRCTSRSAMS